MKKLFSLCLASMLFLGSATLFLGCGGPAETDEPAFEEAEMPDPGDMDTTGTDPSGPPE